MTTKTWTLTLTPPDRPATTRTGLSREEMMRTLRGMLYGEAPRASEGDDLDRAA